MNNKTTLSLLGGALLSGAAYAGPVVAPVVPEACCPVEGEVAVGYHSDYIWRGAKLGSDLVDASVTLSKSAWGLDFSGGAWYGSFDERITDVNVDELDLFFEVSKDFGFARFNTGYIWYNTDISPVVTVDTAEVYVGLSKDLCWGLSSSLTYFIDASGELSSDEGDNNGYSEFVLEKSDLFFDGLSLGNTLGYAVEKGQLLHNTTTLGYAYEFCENVSLNPYVAYTWELDGLEEHGQGYPSEQNRFFGGVSLAVSF